jgi:ATP phosphoribosyltransferase regulatory subunit
MAQYGLDVPATGFTFSLLHLLFALDKNLDATIAPGSDLLVYSTGDNLRAAQKLAHLLRQRGYKVARDIIKRQIDETLVYARQMNYRYVAVIATEDLEIELIKLTDSSRRRIGWQQIQHPDFTL